MLIFVFLAKYLKKHLFQIAVLICAVILIVNRNIYIIDFFKYFLILFIFWILVKGFILDLSKKLFFKKVKITELEKGMIPIEAIIKKEKKYKKEKHNLLLFLKNENDYLFDIMPEGLTKDDIIKIKRLLKNGKLKFRNMKIHQTIPFAPFIFLGTIITMLVQGNLLVFLRLLLAI